MVLASWALHPAERYCGLAQGVAAVQGGWRLAWIPGLESRRWGPGAAAESLVTSAAVGIRTGGSGAAGLEGRASAGRGFRILGAEETELGEGPLQGKRFITFKISLG